MICNGEKVQHEGLRTDIITDLSLDWLKNKRDKTKPFLLMCHHKAPHREWEPASRNLSLFEGVKFPEPPTLFDDYAGRGKAEHQQDMMIASTMNDRDLKLVPPAAMTPEQRKPWDAYYEPRNEAFRTANLQGKDLVRWKYQRYLHDYFACIASIDESVGKLLDYLHEAGLDQNTIVVYSSDQGFFLGEHGWFDKRWIFEQSLREPPAGTMAGRDQAGECKRRHRVEPRLRRNLPRCGRPSGAPGNARTEHGSCSPGETPADWRNAFYYHYYEHPGRTQRGPPVRSDFQSLQVGILL